MKGLTRRVRSRHAAWRRRLSEWKRSGLSQAAFCRRHGLREQQFSWWKQRLGSRRPARTATKAKVAPKSAAFVPVQLSEAEAGGWAFEIEGAGGVRLRFRKRPGVSRLRELVELLSGEARWC